MQLFELKKDRAAVLEKLDALVTKAEREHRAITSAENMMFEADNRNLAELTKKIEKLESQNSIRGLLNSKGQLISENRQPYNPNPAFRHPRTFSAQHQSELLAYLASRGQTAGASLPDLQDPFGFGGHLLVGPQSKMGAILNEGRAVLQFR